MFLQHTYLTILVKAIAARVLDLAVGDPAEMLSGRLLANEGIVGAVEADFFDWPLLAGGGDDLVRSLAAETVRFRLRDVEVDVLKSLYESLIDPDERHDLGEYYTPDWLAARIVAAAIPRPLEQRVLDPSCGSGTFLFHALRRLIQAGREADMPPSEIVAICAERVFGIDVHPVAVALARVTWLLALGDLVQDRPPTLTVPVFMGELDAMEPAPARRVGRSAGGRAAERPAAAHPCRAWRATLACSSARLTNSIAGSTRLPSRRRSATQSPAPARRPRTRPCSAALSRS